MPVSTLDHPTIFEVFDPELNLHSVMVRMSNTLAKKYPNKPWGTPLSDIVVEKYSSKFPNYILVAFEPVQGADDLFWIFQNLADARGWTTKSKTKDDLIPAKFKGQVIRVITKTDVAPDTDATTLTGDLISSVVEQQPNTGKAVKSETTETIDLNVAALVGEEYGDIVTKSVSESLVVEGTAADTGTDVISSVVDPTGDGKAVRQTKRVKGGTWPDPLDKEVTKENGNNPPPRYTKDIVRTKTSRKIATGSIPSNPTLSGNEIGKSYTKETPDRAEEVITTQTLTLNTSSVDEAREQKPFVSILSRMTPGTDPVLPTTGNGSARLVYEAPDGSKIYENTTETATARPGLKGVETDAQQWGALVSTTNYTTNPNAPSGGSVQIIFNDGALTMYEATSTNANPSGGSIEVDPREWGSLRWSGSYSFSPSGLRSRQVWSNGVNSVYLNETPILTIASESFVSGKETNPLYTMTDTSSFGATAVANSDNSRSRLVFSQGSNRVYENIDTTVTSRGSRTYGTVVQFRLPAILTNLYIDSFPGNGDDINVVFNPIIEEGMEGFFPATVTERFELLPTGPTGAIVSFNPTPIHVSTPFGTLSIGATLHVGFNLTYTYRGLSRTINIPATSRTTWRGAGRILVGYQCDPFRNGYITREIHVNL